MDAYAGDDPKRVAAEKAGYWLPNMFAQRLYERPFNRLMTRGGIAKTRVELPVVLDSTLRVAEDVAM